jgi:peptide/nickel transport system permease protein
METLDETKGNQTGEVYPFLEKTRGIVYHFEIVSWGVVCPFSEKRVSRTADDGCSVFLCSVKQKKVEVEKILKKRRIGQRLFQILIVLFGISFLTFGLTYLSPGDPAEIMLTECGNLPTPELLAKTRAELGLDKPFLVQYGSWLKGVLTGNMGTSYSFKVPVIDKLVSCFFPTVKLAFASLVLMLLLSLPLGILSAVYQNRWIDYLVRGITFLGVSIPSFWVGLILLRVFGVNLRWVPVSGGSTDFKSLIMPALTLAFSMSAKYTRQVRTAVLDELRKDYVTGARMRGLSESKILWRHVLPNAMLPLVTLLGLSLGNLLGGTTVVEIIYNWPGMGSMAVKAISCRDYPLVQGYVLWIALLYLGINLLVDISYRRLDPRIKEEIG